MWIAISLTIITIVIGKFYFDDAFKKVLLRNQELMSNLKTQKEEYHKLYSLVMSEVDEMHHIINKSNSIKETNTANEVTFGSIQSAAQSLEEIDGILSKLETYIAKASVVSQN